MDQIQGQDRVIESLRAQLAAGRTHHGYIFHGPAGVGKFTTALAYAQLLLCHARQTTLTGQPEACGTCESCRYFSATPPAADETDGDDDAALRYAHPDLHVVTKELAKYSDDRSTRQRKLMSIPVEVVREALIEPAPRSPALRHGKVFIVDEAELLNDAGQNALLKTLEEPTPGTTIILVTSSEDRLLPTIRSRCQRVGFVPLPDEVVARHVDEHGESLSPKLRQWLVGFSGGSLGRAQLALDHGLDEWASTLLPKLHALGQGKPAGEMGAEMADRINAFAEGWTKAHANASKEAANRLAAGLMWNLLTTYARRRIGELAEGAGVDDPAGAEAVLEPWLTVIDAVTEAERLLTSNVNLSLVCDHVAMTIDAAFADGKVSGGV